MTLSSLLVRFALKTEASRPRANAPVSEQFGIVSLDTDSTHAPLFRPYLFGVAEHSCPNYAQGC